MANLRSHPTSSQSDMSSRDTLSTRSATDKSQENFQSSHHFTPRDGEALNDRYQIQECIGHGRFSKVHRATDKEKRQGGDVALKIYRASAEFYEYFLNEIKLCDKFGGASHPNVMTPLDSFVIESDDGTHGVIVYEAMPGDIKSLLDSQEEGLPVSEARQLIIQVAKGLQFLHERSIIHADIKPENLLVTTNDLNQKQIKICDIGSGMIVDEIDSFRVGTIPYIAPELILGVKFDTKIDVWSLGCLLFELITSECLFDPDMYLESDVSESSSCHSSRTSNSEQKGSEPLQKKDSSGEDYLSTENVEMNEANETDAEFNRHDGDTDSDDEDMQGYEWEANHFQLSSFKAILGRLPIEKFQSGQYFSLFYSRTGRLRSVPRCIDRRNMRKILIEDFEFEEDDAVEIEEDILSLLIYDPDQRPDAAGIISRFQEKYT